MLCNKIDNSGLHIFRKRYDVHYKRCVQNDKKITFLRQK